MPRVSLPSTLKKLTTYEVLITQTTETDIRSHISTLFGIFDTNKDKYTQRISDVVGMFLDENPYANRDWKKRTPTRHYKESFAWFGENEDDMKEYFSFTNLFRDINIVAKHFEWEELANMIYEMERFTTHISTGQNDLLQLESCRFLQAKKQFEEENKEWIQEQAEIKTHKSTHLTGHILRIKEEEGETIDLSCKYCKMDYDKEVESIRKFREMNPILCSSDPEPDSTPKPKPIPERKKEAVEQICEDCGYKSYYKHVFEFHKQEPQHKRIIQLKSWHCDCCKVQCQSQIKYNEHLETVKHKKNIGNIQVSHEYICEKCDYKTKIKHHYEQHCNTSKHLEKEVK